MKNAGFMLRSGWKSCLSRQKTDKLKLPVQLLLPPSSSEDSDLVFILTRLVFLRRLQQNQGQTFKLRSFSAWTLSTGTLV